MPGTPTGRTRRPAADTTLDRRLRALVIAGGVTFVVLLVVLATTLFRDANPQRAAQPSAPPGPVASTDAEPDPVEPTAESPSPIATEPPRRLSPAELITGIQVGLSQLVRDDEIDKGAARELSKRLGEVRRALNNGETDKAWNKLREMAEKLEDLRDEDDDDELTPAGYAALQAAFTQLAQSLPPRS